MAGIGKFKLSDALPKSSVETSRAAKAGAKGKATAGDAGAAELTAEQAREIRETALAKNAEASIRGHMIDIGRGNQQAGRQQQGGGRRGK